MDGRGLLTIGEVAGRAGIATSALRYYEQQGLVASVRSAVDSGATREASWAGSPSCGRPRTSACPSRRSALPSTLCPPAARRRKRIGLGCRGPGSPGSTSRSPVCRSSATASPAASAAAACHCAPARCRTPATCSQRRDRVPATSRPRCAARRQRDAPQASTDRPAPDAEMVHVQIRGFHKLGTRPTVRSCRDARLPLSARARAARRP